MHSQEQEERYLTRRPSPEIDPSDGDNTAVRRRRDLNAGPLRTGVDDLAVADVDAHMSAIREAEGHPLIKASADGQPHTGRGPQSCRGGQSLYFPLFGDLFSLCSCWIVEFRELGDKILVENPGISEIRAGTPVNASRCSVMRMVPVPKKPIPLITWAPNRVTSLGCPTAPKASERDWERKTLW